MDAVKNIIVFGVGLLALSFIGVVVADLLGGGVGIAQSNASTFHIDTPGTVVGALKSTNEITIYAAHGKIYKSITPFWITPDKDYIVFDAKRESDNKLVRVYAYAYPQVVIEEMLQKEDSK